MILVIYSDNAYRIIWGLWPTVKFITFCQLKIYQLEYDIINVSSSPRVAGLHGAILLYQLVVFPYCIQHLHWIDQCMSLNGSSMLLCPWHDLQRSESLISCISSDVGCVPCHKIITNILVSNPTIFIYTIVVAVIWFGS